MNRRDVALWSAIGMLALVLLVVSAVAFGEIAEIQRTLSALAGAERSAAVESTGASSWWQVENTPDAESVRVSDGPQVGIAGVQVLSDTVAMTVTVRSSGAGDLLYEPPVLVNSEGRTYPVTGESLEAARLAFLDLVTRGQAQAGLAFCGSLQEGARLVLVFNPNQEPGHILAPRVEVPVPVVAAPTLEK